MCKDACQHPGEPARQQGVPVACLFLLLMLLYDHRLPLLPQVPWAAAMSPPPGWLPPHGRRSPQVEAGMAAGRAPRQRVMAGVGL